MDFKMKPYRELVAMSQETIDEALAPMRARSAQKKAELMVMELDEKILDRQRLLQKFAMSKDINLNAICDELDEIALMELRQSRLREIVASIFPQEGA